MNRFFASFKGIQNEEVSLEESEAYHATHVMRLRVKDCVELLNGRGSRAKAEIIQIVRKEVRVRILESVQMPPPHCAITLYQAICKGKGMDLILQKAVELGAASIVPVLTEHCVVQLDEEDAESKADKWRVATLEAAKQCGAAWLPQIATPTRLTKLAAVIGKGKSDLWLVAALAPEAAHPRQWLKQYLSANKQFPKSIGYWVGPEGDFTRQELETLFQAGTKPITLGPLVLRAETAVFYGLSVIQYEAQWAQIEVENREIKPSL